MRVFFALPVPDEEYKETSRWRTAVSSEMPDARLIPEFHQHVTLRFIGDAEDEAVVMLRGICREVASDAAPILSKLSGLGVLPSFSRPRVVYIGMSEGRGEVEALSQVISQRIAETDTQGFLPHITVARIRGAASSSVKRLCRIQLPPARVTFRKMVLYRSVLRKAGALYQPLQTVQLGGG